MRAGTWWLRIGSGQGAGGGRGGSWQPNMPPASYWTYANKIASVDLRLIDSLVAYREVSKKYLYFPDGLVVLEAFPEISDLLHTHPATLPMQGSLHMGRNSPHTLITPQERWALRLTCTKSLVPMTLSCLKLWKPLTSIQLETPGQ